MSNKKELIKVISRVLLCMVFFLIITISFGALFMYKDDVESEALFRGKYYTDEMCALYQEGLDNHKRKVQRIQDDVNQQEFTDRQEFLDYFSRVILSSETDGAPKYGRFYIDGVEYKSDGVKYEESENSKITSNVNSHEVMCLGVIGSDRQFSVETIAYIVPLKNNEFADCLILFYIETEIVPEDTDLDLSKFPVSEMSLIASREGEVLSFIEVTNNQFDLHTHSLIYDKLTTIIGDKDLIDEVTRSVYSGKTQSFPFKLNGGSYILSAATIKNNGLTTFTIITIFSLDNIHSIGSSLTDTVLVLLIIFSLLIIGLLVYSIITRNKIQRIKVDNDTHSVLNIAKEEKFIKTANDILIRNPATTFAIIVADIKHYEYTLEQLGEDNIFDGLKRVKNLLVKSLQLEETIGYLNNGRFVFLIHYRDDEILQERIKHMTLLAGSQAFKGGKGASINIYGGIYSTDRKITPNVGKMIELAISAENATEYPCDFLEFRMYNETIHESVVQNDYIELNMEHALEHKDFKVFFQPKQNIATGLVDGCEALVRWYNPEINDYMQPGVFIPLFESNMFIIKLDHYVFESVCEYINDAIENSMPLCPISVNVSRITASQPDFLRFYINMKDKYNIANNFITIEFTESFAFEDYKSLRDIITSLHQHGFKCSIDDFGSGFSSYNILKELPMDELKLDRFFIKQGFSNERDLMVLSSVIELGKELHMKVVQEGVETIEQFNLLKSLGCHTIQGFLYSKPLVVTDFIAFLNQKKVY